MLLVCAVAPAQENTSQAEKSQTDAPARPAAEEELSPESQRLVEELKNSLRNGSEAEAMLLDILKGSQMGPDDGWFKVAKSQSRFGWDHVQRTYDADADEEISRNEFPGDEPDFARLDRNSDDTLSKEDFDWPVSAIERTAGLMLFYQADRDGNGKVTREEFVSVFDSLDADGAGYLALDDLRDQFSTNRRPRGSTQEPTKDVLVKGLYRQEIGSLQPGPSLGEQAPDFTLKTLGGRDVTLSQVVGPKPVVLVFGNFTCGPFRSQSGNVEKLYERYKDRAEFLLIYVREAHPTDGWRMESNDRVHVELEQPQTYEERFSVAQTCRQHLDLNLPFLVDTIDDRVGAQYSGMPSRLYVIDSEGRVAFKSGRGPFGFRPQEMEQALVLLLAQQDRIEN
jgi:hypothetical protein